MKVHVTTSLQPSSPPSLFLIWPLVILLFELRTTSGDDSFEGGILSTPTHSTRGFHIGDTCQDSCSSVIENSYCNNKTNTCQCLDTHPIEIDGVTCVEPKNLFESCTYNQQCSNRNEQAICQQYEQHTRCSCRNGYHEEKAHEIPIRYECILDATGPLSGTVPAIVGLFIALSILLFLFCFMFKLFTQSRWARARAYADANQPPPDITIEDEQIDLEKQRLYPETEIQIYSPGGGHISKNSSRRGSGNNNSDKNSLSHSSYSQQSRRGSNRSSCGGDSDLDHRTSLQRNGAIVTSDLAFNFDDKDCDIEQHITIIPNPRAKRRSSMADHAFPELHSRTAKKEPENILILTRTRTDRHGRRHSVAVPLIPPPDGEKFEGGYHVERNPLTGGAKLVPPPGAQFVISKSQKCAWLVSRTGSTRDRNRTTTNLSMPTIGESSEASNTNSNTSVPINGTSRRPIRTRSCRLPTSSSSLRSQTSLATSSRPRVHVSQQPRSRSLGLEVPGASNKRRHSFQSSGVSGLTKDMDRLKVSPVAEGGGNTPRSSRGVSPRGSTRRRASTVRRSSRSGFLHFLDLAIAN